MLLRQRTFIVIAQTVVLVGVLNVIWYQEAKAEWSAGGDFSTYYTDNAALFSITRRLSLEQDPTQPVVDEPEHGNDFVYEPHGYLKWQSENKLGEFELAFDAGGYVFQDHSDFSHSFFQLEVSQQLRHDTELEFFYDFIPGQYLGKKEFPGETHHSSELIASAKEALDSHVLSIHVEHDVSNTLLIRGLVRYGKRFYDRPFTYRDVDFFTVGSHLEWMITPEIELLVGYQFERGYTDRNDTRQFSDDIGYINHYASAELLIEAMPRLEIKLIVDFEHNQFTTPFEEDIHYQGSENVYQGELELLYQLNRSMKMKAGWQYGTRKFNYESFWVENNNVWVGVEYDF